MQTVALAAREVFHKFLLIAAAEIKAARIRARRHFVAADDELLVAVGDFLPHCVVAVKRIAALIDIRELNRVA